MGRGSAVARPLPHPQGWPPPPPTSRARAPTVGSWFYGQDPTEKKEEVKVDEAKIAALKAAGEAAAERRKKMEAEAAAFLQRKKAAAAAAAAESAELDSKLEESMPLKVSGVREPEA